LSIVVSHLKKSYGRLVAVDDISFEVPSGALFAFLGSNGAGKSTTIGCITTTIQPSSGRIEVDGADVATDAPTVRKHIGAVYQSSLLDPLLTVRENLDVRGRLYGLGRRAVADRVAELSDLVGMEETLDRRYGTLSGGQKRRADIARALLHRPAVVFLDEPTAGLDPQSREQIWSAIQQLRHSSGTTVFLTTHYMEETERADSVCIVDHGRIVAAGTPAQLRAKHTRSLLTVRGGLADDVAAAAGARGLQIVDRSPDGEVVIAVGSSAEAIEFLRSHHVDDFEFRHGTMDDVFLAVTKDLAA
jgi:multidrug/hemolysin transport system ATP-binding protein